ncbi:ABC transporter permease [Borreliella burgdorferi]|uniref:ABC transporter permease n=1 Tax=Borreliella burgdorferi TaxID=139 RepID=UPI00016C4865|nr:ABC transporter permease [Borreliella burgdorferi]EEG99764.1 conserved hypothetical integral membrane protein [Borreliella burgdorferi 94a]
MIFFRNSFMALIFSFSILSISYFFGDFFQFSYIKMISWRFILFLIMATGIATCAKSNSLNLGNEGQIYFGAFLVYIFSSFFGLTHFNFVFLILLSSFFVGLLGLIPFFITFFFGLNKALTGLLISYGNQRLVDGFILNMLKTGSFSNQTKRINSLFALDSSLIYLFLLGVSVWLFYVFIHKKTIYGLQLEILSNKKKIDIFFNINEFKYKFFAVFGSAFLNGLAGSMFVVFFRPYLVLGLTSGLGWSSLIVAVISGFNYVYVLFFSLLFSILIEFNNFLNINYDFKYEFIGLCQSIAIFISLFLIKARKK